MRFLSFLAAMAAFGAVSAANIVITVGGNTTRNASSVFVPSEVTAKLGDTVYFNFTQGNHTATQSLFATPCIPAHEANITVNGFDSGFRNAGNGTAITILSVPILAENVNTTMWFFDYNTCGQGGVGAINANDSYGSYQNFDAFVRNAERLNGTSTSSSASSATRTNPSSSTFTPSSSSSAERNIVLGGAAVLPLVLAALSL